MQRKILRIVTCQCRGFKLPKVCSISKWELNCKSIYLIITLLFQTHFTIKDKFGLFSDGINHIIVFACSFDFRGHIIIVFHFSCCSIHFLKDGTLIESFIGHIHEYISVRQLNSLLGLGVADWHCHQRRGAGHSSTKVGWSLAPWSTTVCAAWPHIVSLSAILAPQCNWNQSSKQPLLCLKGGHHQIPSAEIGFFLYFLASLAKVGDWPSPQKHSARNYDSCQPQFNRDIKAQSLIYLFCCSKDTQNQLCCNALYPRFHCYYHYHVCLQAFINLENQTILHGV